MVLAQNWPEPTAKSPQRPPQVRMNLSGILSKEHEAVSPVAPACSKRSFHSNCLTYPITIQALINDRDKTQTCLDRNEASELFSEMNQTCYCKQNTLGRGKLLISHHDFIFMFK